MLYGSPWSLTLLTRRRVRLRRNMKCLGWVMRQGNIVRWKICIAHVLYESLRWVFHLGGIFGGSYVAMVICECLRWVFHLGKMFGGNCVSNVICRFWSCLWDVLCYQILWRWFLLHCDSILKVCQNGWLCGLRRVWSTRLSLMAMLLFLKISQGKMG